MTLGICNMGIRRGLASIMLSCNMGLNTNNIKKTYFLPNYGARREDKGP